MQFFGLPPNRTCAAAAFAAPLMLAALLAAPSAAPPAGAASASSELPPRASSATDQPAPCAFLVVAPAPDIDRGFLLPSPHPPAAGQGTAPTAGAPGARPNCHPIPPPVPLTPAERRASS